MTGFFELLTAYGGGKLLKSFAVRLLLFSKGCQKPCTQSLKIFQLLQSLLTLKTLELIDVMPVHRKFFLRTENYSNSIVAGGLLVQSYKTRLTPLTSFTILLAILFKIFQSICAASAVMKSFVKTARRTIA